MIADSALKELEIAVWPRVISPARKSSWPRVISLAGEASADVADVIAAGFGLTQTLS